jgi:hypothetical protein
VQADDVTGDLSRRLDPACGRKVMASRQPRTAFVDGETPGG